VQDIGQPSKVDCFLNSMDSAELLDLPPSMLRHWTSRNVASIGIHLRTPLGKKADTPSDLLLVEKPANSVVDLPAHATQFGCGVHFAVACTSDGNIFSWGLNTSAQLAHSATEPELSALSALPRRVLRPPPAEITAIACGGEHVLAVSVTGNVWIWGSNEYGQSAQGKGVPCVYQPTRVSELDHLSVIDACAGLHFSLVLTDDGEVFVWGVDLLCVSAESDSCSDSEEAPSCGQSTLLRSPMLISFPHGALISMISAGWAHCLVVSEDGELFGWGDCFEVPPVGSPKHVSRPADLGKPLCLSSGKSFSVLICEQDSAIVGFGRSDAYQLGDRSQQSGQYTQNAEHLLGLHRGLPSASRTVACGTADSAVILEDGRLFFWGQSTKGLLQSLAFTDCTAVSMGHYHGLCQREGRLYSWSNRQAASGALGRPFLVGPFVASVLRNAHLPTEPLAAGRGDGADATTPL
jgi:alpha-tubulin suppressor-like RCC1 family protein